jgi:hypothetical protein
MNSEKAFFISLREKLFIFTPLERIVMSCVSRKVKKLIHESWENIEPFYNRSIYNFFIICNSLQYAKNGYFSPITNSIGNDLITSTSAKKIYYINKKTLDHLEYATDYCNKNTYKYYLKKDVINAALAAWKGPKMLMNRMNKHFDRNSKIETLIPNIHERELMKNDGTWFLCVHQYIKNGKGGIKEVSDRLSRMKTWKEERNKNFNVEYIFDYYRDNFVKGIITFEKIQSLVKEEEEKWLEIKNRRKILKSMLKDAGLVLREDSKLCRNYIMNGIGYAPNIVKTMRKMHWFNTHKNV